MVRNNDFFFGCTEDFNEDVYCFNNDLTTYKKGYGMFRFLSNAKSFSINFEIARLLQGNYPHLGITAQNGISILYRNRISNYGNWMHVNCTMSRNNVGDISVDMSRFFEGEVEYEILIYSPILSVLKSLCIEVSEEFFVKPIRRYNQAKILCLGGINTAGIGCTSAAFSFPNILNREDRYEVFNVSFMNNDFLTHISKMLSSVMLAYPVIDYVIFEADYIRQRENVFLDNYDAIINQLLKYGCPIAVWSVGGELHKRRVDVHYLDIDKTLKRNPDKYMHSSNFINDYGNILLYKEINRFIEKGNM